MEEGGGEGERETESMDKIMYIDYRHHRMSLVSTQIGN
jgi:hypothetical protein